MKKCVGSRTQLQNFRGLQYSETAEIDICLECGFFLLNTQSTFSWTLPGRWNFSLALFFCQELSKLALSSMTQFIRMSLPFSRCLFLRLRIFYLLYSHYHSVLLFQKLEISHLGTSE